MGALLDLWKSERGIVAVALIAAATVMSGLGIITVDQWLDYTKWLFVTYAAAKTVTGAVAAAQSKGTTPAGIWQEIEALIGRAVANATTPVPPPPTAPHDYNRSVDDHAAALTGTPISIVPPPKAS